MDVDPASGDVRYAHEAHEADLEKQSRDKIRPTKEQLWMMLALWVAKKPTNAFVDEGGAVLLNKDGFLLDVGVGAISEEANCSHSVADLVCRLGRSLCTGGTLFLSSRMRCCLCAKLVIQSGLARVLQNIPEAEVRGVAESKQGSRTRSISSLGNNDPKFLALCRHSSLALHEFCLELEGGGQFLRVLKDLEKLVKLDEQHAKHVEDMWFMGMAYIVRERSDDIQTGCGAIIAKNGHIFSVGWNGLIARATNYDFPLDKNDKLPYMVHSEQNALLYRRIQDIDGATIYATRLPCHECAPRLLAVGKDLTVVFCAFPADRPNDGSDVIKELIAAEVEVKRIRITDYHEATKCVALPDGIDIIEVDLSHLKIHAEFPPSPKPSPSVESPTPAARATKRAKSIKNGSGE